MCPVWSFWRSINAIKAIYGYSRAPHWTGLTMPSFSSSVVRARSSKSEPRGPSSEIATERPPSASMILDLNLLSPTGRMKSGHSEQWLMEKDEKPLQNISPS